MSLCLIFKREFELTSSISVSTFFSVGTSKIIREEATKQILEYALAAGYRLFGMYLLFHLPFSYIELNNCRKILNHIIFQSNLKIK